MLPKFMLVAAFLFCANVNATFSAGFNRAVRTSQDRWISANNARRLDVRTFIGTEMHAATSRALLDCHFSPRTEVDCASAMLLHSIWQHAWHTSILSPAR